MKRWILICIFVLCTVNLHAYNSITNARIENGNLVLVFAKPVPSENIRYFKINSSNSTRYIFDFTNTVIKNSRIVNRLHYKYAKYIRASQYKKHIVRVVIESRTPYSIAHKKTGKRSYKILLPRKTSHGKYARIESPSDLFDSIYIENRNQDTPKSIIKVPKKRYTIVIDAGHGGKDSGALDPSRRYMEKSVVLKIAKRLRVHLKALGFKVYMTRDSNRFVTLGGRTRYANKHHADAFVSIHANAAKRSRRDEAQGIETYFLQVSRSARSRRVAARENSVVLHSKDKISKNVILNLITGPKIVMSNKMAIDVQKGMLKNLKKVFRSTKDNGVRPAPFWVLVGAQMPSILVETGYITHPAEKQRLINPSYQNLIAKGIAEGISNYFSNREREME